MNDKPITPYLPLPCAGCRYRCSALGVVWCSLGKWEGLINEQRCDEWEHRK
jgi:hypothetical protein